MDIEKLRWLALRDDKRGQCAVRYSLFVQNITDGRAMLVLFSYELVQDISSEQVIGTDISSDEIAEDQRLSDKETDLLRAEQITFPYTSDTLSGALTWIEANGFVADMYALAELVRALDE